MNSQQLGEKLLAEVLDKARTEMWFVEHWAQVHDAPYNGFDTVRARVRVGDYLVSIEKVNTVRDWSGR
jgi:hypothetical protein